MKKSDIITILQKTLSENISDLSRHNMLIEAAKGCPVMAIFITEETGKQIYP